MRLCAQSMEGWKQNDFFFVKLVVYNGVTKKRDGKSDGTDPKQKNEKDVKNKNKIKITFFNFLGSIGFGGDNGWICMLPLSDETLFVILVVCCCVMQLIFFKFKCFFVLSFWLKLKLEKLIKAIYG